MDDMLRRSSTPSRLDVPSAPPLRGKIVVKDMSAEPAVSSAQPQIIRPAAPEAPVSQVPEATGETGDKEPEPPKDTDETAMGIGGTEIAAGKPNPVTRILGGYWRRKLWTLPLTLLVIVGIIAAVPTSRYPILAMFIKRAYTVTVTDSKTDTPVSGAQVTLDGQTVTTDNTGKARFVAKVGKGQLAVTKQYYQGQTDAVFVDIATDHNSLAVALNATGRQVPVTVLDKISGMPVPNALVSVLDTQARTDAKGQVTIVLPTSSPELAIDITADNYTELTANVQVTSSAVSANTFNMVPAGRVYFLSNLSGKIDVVSTNLDGSGRKTVLAGTGSEDSSNTVLLASRDWQYLALLSKRDGGKYAKLFLINTNTNQTTTIDDGSSYFTPIGWSDHYFLYEANRDDLQAWDTGKVLINSYNADSAKLTTIDQTTAQGTSGNYTEEDVGFVNLVGGHVVYGFTWNTPDSGGPALGPNKNSINTAAVNGSSKVDLRDIAPPAGTTYSTMNAVLVKPGMLDIQISMESQPSVYYIYQGQNNSATQSGTITDDSFGQAEQNLTTYLESPTGDSTFWTQLRDGKNTLFVGDANGLNSTQIASLSPYSPYGWYTDNYLLVQQNDSELFIMPAAGGTPLKVSDYYKPAYSFYGYGGGYGGL